MSLKCTKDSVVLPLQEKADNTKSNKKAMRRVEVKNIVDWFLKPTSEEKTPIIPSSKAFQYSGFIPSDPKMNDSGENQKGFFHRKPSEEKSTTESGEDAEKKPKMSILRKLCFLLSLNGGVVYVAAFLWFIPCRQPFCMQQQKDWAMNISGKLTSNMEATQPSSGELSSVIFGYSDVNGGNLASFSTSDGKMKWNKRTNSVLRHVFCNYNHLDGNVEGIPKCVVTAYNYIAAFNDSNGNLLWERNITNPEGEIMHKIALAGNSKSGFYILGVSDAYLFMVDANNGSQVATVDLPCQWTIDVKLVGPLENNSWILVCEYGDSVEVRTFNEKALLSPALQKSTREKSESSNQEKFKLLFKRANSPSTGAIDLAGDVTRISDSLILSWADMVAMVTTQAPSSQPARAWEVRSWGARGGSPAVTSILSGNFTDPNEIQVAVAVQDEYNATIHILDAKNGTSVRRTNLGTRSVMSMEKITGEKDETDVIVIESVHKINAKNVDPSSSEVLLSTRAYFTMQCNVENVTYQNIATSEVFESILIPHSMGVASLLIASQDTNGETVLKRHVVTSQQQETVCHWGIHRNITTVLLLD